VAQARPWIVRAADTMNAVPRRLLSGFGRRYRRYLAEIHHDVELPGPAPRGAQPLALDQVFVDLSLVRRPAPGPQRSTIWEYLRTAERRPLAVIGAPGSGKTTLLKHVTLGLARGRRLHREARPRTPILVQLREHATAITADPELALADVARSSLRLSEPPRWFDRQLATGRCVVLFDGLDEVARPAERRAVVAWVERQAALHRRNVFVLTSRPSGYTAHPLPGATVLQVRPFTSRQVAAFVRGWYLATQTRIAGRLDEEVRRAARSGADDLLARLRHTKALADLTANPLQLTLIANVHCHQGKLPERRVDLYREVFRVLLARRPEVHEVPIALSPDQKEFVLGELALAMMERGIRDVTATDAADLLARALATVRPELDPKEFLVAMEHTSGLLRELPNGLHCFAHLTLQEYLAAGHIRGEGRLSLLLERLGGGWWRETTLLYAAQADASPLVAACLRTEEPEAELLALAADLAEQADRLEPDLRDRLTGALDAATLSGNGARRQLLTGVELTRTLRDVTHLSDDLTVTSAPISRRTYQLHRDGEVRDRTAPAGGLRAAEARDFARWASEAGCDGWAYRLPTAAEAAEIAAAQLIDRSTQGLWLCDEPEPWLDPGFGKGDSDGQAAVIMLVRE
jgi:hypothetical protein